MKQFQCVVISERSRDSWKDRGERASVERPIAVGRLQDTVNLGNKIARNCWEVTNVSFDLPLSLLPFPLIGSN